MKLADVAAPHDLRSEAALCGAVLLDPAVLERVRVDFSDFWRESHRALWRTYLALHSRGEPIDTVSMIAALKAAGQYKRAGGAVYLVELQTQCPSSINAEFYARQVVNLALVRRAADTLGETRRELLTKAFDPDSLEAAVELAERNMNAALAPLRRDDSRAAGHETLGRTFSVLLEDLEDAIDGRGVKAGPSVTTTFPDLDALCLAPVGALFLVGARPQIGKSALCSQLHEGFRRRADWPNQPHTFNLEDLNKHAAIRMLARDASMSARRIRDLIYSHPTDARVESDRNRLGPFLVRAAERGTTWDDSSGVTVERLRVRARSAVREGADVLLIDHALKIKLPNWRNATKRERVDHVIGELSDMAHELNVPVFCFTQLRRIKDNRKPKLEDLRETGKWEEDARVVLLLHREREDIKNRKAHEGLWIVAKANHDRTGEIAMWFDPARAEWRPQKISEGGPF